MLNTDAIHERLVEGVDDPENRRPAQRSWMQQNGTCRHNTHDPSANARYFNVSNAFQHLGGLTEAVSRAFINPPPPPARTVTDIRDDFARSSEQLKGLYS